MGWLNFILLSSFIVALLALLIPPLLEPDVGEVVKGKRCLVTGASLGIGKEIARELVHIKASHITIVARSENKLNEFRDEVLHSFKKIDDTWEPEIHVISADLSTRETSEKVIESAIKKMNGMDYLVLNHITNSRYGLWTEQPNHDFVPEMFDVNTLSYIWMANAALPTLQARGGADHSRIILGRMGRGSLYRCLLGNEACLTRFFQCFTNGVL